MLDPVALPEELRALAGRIIDTDTHEMIPCKFWVEIFGTEWRELQDAWTSSVTGQQGRAAENLPQYSASGQRCD